ncbi:CynX/NimT family MFS transporter [Tumebacillus lipolyticus]|uniref:CynX/NimT family MFS transporter n=1 Tax=Tumebacillus lipolyticus TaxID=1280370 RepID=A0ABW5A0S7_9BACL
MTAHTESQYNKLRIMLLIAGIVLIAANLRPALTAVGPLIGSIKADMGLSNGMAGLLTTLPLLAFALFSPLAPRLGARFGNERSLFAGLIILIAGLFWRSTGSSIALYGGTILLGLGIAIGNVLLPGLIKEKFPKKVGMMTSVYSTALSISAAIASGVSIPLTQGLNLSWQGALATWSALAILAVIVWLPQLRSASRAVGQQQAQSSGGQLWRSPLAWQVTLFMGLQSFAFYCSVAWLPEILQNNGMSVSAAGWMLSIVQFISLPATILTPMLAARFANQRALAMIVGVLFVFGFTGLLLDETNDWIYLWLVLLGTGQGAGISLALTLIVMRAANVRQAAELSGMAQSIGYLLAAIGPILIGTLFDLTHSWWLPLLTLVVSGALLAVIGLGAGRNRYV